MIITYHGVGAFKVQFGDTVVAVNPVSKDSKLKSAKFGAGIALISINHPDYNGVDQVTYGEKVPFVASGPGEYEVGGVMIKGFTSSSAYGETPKINTIYRVTLEGMQLCFLGALASPELPGETLEALDSVDVLFVPIGGDGVLTPAQAEKLSVNLGPKIIIPCHYGQVGDDKALANFKKATGSEKIAEVDKLTIKKKDLEGKENEVVILSPSI